MTGEGSLALLVDAFLAAAHAGDLTRFLQCSTQTSCFEPTTSSPILRASGSSTWEPCTIDELTKMAANLLKSALHNVGVIIVGLGIAYLGRMADLLFGVSAFVSPLARALALLLLVLGFLVRLWATFHFYAHNMRVISLEPQTTLITSGPYRFSRNPLYLGGNVFVFFGAALLLGSPTALVVTALHIPLMDRFIRREEKQLERNFGDEWRSYKRRVRRWL